MAIPRNKAVLATINEEGDSSMSDKSAYREKLEARLEQWRAEIDKLQAKAAEASADARKDYEDQVAELRKQQDEAREKLKELDEASDDAWEDIKDGVEKAWDKLGDAVKSARERFS
jgi:septal ring factor EnvC (AmiA/AmiB activator)